MLKPISQHIGDDCAYFDGFCITKDVLAAGTHFFADDEPFNLARKALRVNLSDLASCGAQPFGFMLGLALPKNTSDAWLEKFTAGLKADITEFNFQLLGGDTITHDAPLLISVTAIGKTSAPITRAGAKVGDNIFVSGNIGDGFIGLKTRSGKYILPQPRIELGINLRGVATSCIDISDGLLADLNHICVASGVSAEVEAAAIPVSASVIPDLVGDLKIPAYAGMTFMDLITGGDDYELCFTAPVDAFAGCTKIGKITAGSGIKLDGKAITPKGYEHRC